MRLYAWKYEPCVCHSIIYVYMNIYIKCQHSTNQVERLDLLQIFAVFFLLYSSCLYCCCCFVLFFFISFLFFWFYLFCMFEKERDRNKMIVCVNTLNFVFYNTFFFGRTVSWTDKLVLVYLLLNPNEYFDRVYIWWWLCICLFDDDLFFSLLLFTKKK